MLAPLAWPLHHSPLPDIGGLANLPGPGALLELPPVTTATPPPGQWRDLLGLVQPQTGRPVGGSLMNLGVSPAARRGQAAVETLLREGSLAAGALDRTRADGFRWLAIYPAYRALPPAAQARLSACFGAPLEQSDTVWVFDLAQAPAAGCPAPADAAP